MKKEIAEAWIKDLRSQPPQTAGLLYDGQGYCCLGRLAVVLGCTFQQVEGNYYPALDGEVVEPRYGTLPRYLMDMAGMKTNDGALPAHIDHCRTLVDLNDLTDASFSYIADVIEKHWEEL